MDPCSKRLTRLLCFVLVLISNFASAQSTPVQLCTAIPQPPWCRAVRGDRSEGWLPQNRSEVMARHGMVSTVQPLAAMAGLRILMQGGNAIDAAVATAAALNVVYPANVGIAGDLFAIIYIASQNRIYQLNASGIAPTGLTLQRMNSLGYQWNHSPAPGAGMPPAGILTVTVPGSLWGWQEVLDRFGTMSFREVLEPAIDYAENGFPVTEEIGEGWHVPNALPLIGCCTQQDPDSINTWYVNGLPPEVGTIFRNPDLAQTFRLIQRHGRQVFYRGEIARAIVAKSNALGGTMTMRDLANYRGEWVEHLASTSYHDQFRVYTTTAPSQAWGILEALNILEQCVPQWYPGESLASLGPANPLFWHALIETKKVTYLDVYSHNADPDVVRVPVEMLTSKEYAATLCDRVDPYHASTPYPMGFESTVGGDTIYLTAADRWGNMVSWINSNFGGFGSGITIPGYGFVLHNRGGLFTLNPDSPNVIAQHKRPYNTLSAVFVTQNGIPLLTTGQHGGDQQGQGNMQVLVNILDLSADLQAAGDMARFSHNQVANTLQMESQLFGLVGQPLIDMGHHVSSWNGGPVGGYEGIMFVPTADKGSNRGDQLNGFYRAGSNFREDGQSVGW